MKLSKCFPRFVVDDDLAGWLLWLRGLRLQARILFLKLSNRLLELRITLRKHFVLMFGGNEID